MKDVYYRVIKERRDYKGDRYFKFNPMSDKVVQVCVNHGEDKRGRTNSFGICLIHRMTLLANYLSIGYVESCTKAEYDKNFNKVLKMLK